MEKNIKTLMEQELEKDFVHFLIRKNKKIIKYTTEFLFIIFISFTLAFLFLFNKSIKEWKIMDYFILSLFILSLIFCILQIIYFYIFLKKIKSFENSITSLKHSDFFKAIFKKNKEKKYLNLYNQHLKKKDILNNRTNQNLDKKFENIIMNTIEVEFEELFRKKIKFSMITSIITYIILIVLGWSLFFSILIFTDWKFDKIIFYPTLIIWILFTLFFIFLIVKNFHSLIIIKKLDSNTLQTHGDLYKFISKKWIIIFNKKDYYLKNYFSFRGWKFYSNLYNWWFFWF